MTNGNTLGWFHQEKKILNALVVKFGEGNYSEYKVAPYLPFRSRWQLSTQIQKCMNLYSIGIFHGLRFDLELGKKFLKDHLGIFTFYKNLPGRFNTYSEKDQMAKLFKAEVVTKLEASEIDIPYLRRLKDPRHIGLLEEEFAMPACKKFLLEHGIDSLKTLRKMRLMHSKDVVDVFLSCKDVLDSFVDFIRSEIAVWHILSQLYSTPQSMETIPKPYFQNNEVETFNSVAG
eukprot:snap_masked-scaffold_3-processed-gene-6.26-mRNA-1 protein AED:1.00 eAED:1.00 QI:0/-1/0/0/-1/1/1/0/230